MSNRIAREEFLNRIFAGRYEELRDSELRMVRVRVPGKDVTLAHIIGSSNRRVYENLGLHIGVHTGEDHTGQSIGLMRFSPWEVTIAAADIAVKAADVEIGFLDRFCGTLILTGSLSEVRTAVEAVVEYFRDVLQFSVCKVTEQ